MSTIIRLIVTLLLLSLLPTRAVGHELQSNRATLVLREDSHLSLTLYLDYCTLLQRTLAPQSSLQEFVLRYAALKPEALRKALLQAQAQLEQGTRISLAAGKSIPLSHWQWPEVTAVQNLLQQRAMQSVVAPNEHPHDTQLEIRAEANASQSVTAISLQLPAAMQPLLLVSYRPSQRWLDSSNGSRQIKF